MPICTFLEHRDCPKFVALKLLMTLVDLIEDHGLDIFYAGRQGEFDAVACRILKEV